MQLEQLSQIIADDLHKTQKRPFLFGVSGGQGAGKTTLCAAVSALLASRNLRCLSLALDDFYLPKADREARAAQVHPNCLTRGVPGTHDVALLQTTLTALHAAADKTQTPLPVFSKSHDDRMPKADWPNYQGQPDIILLEGWCVGGRAAFLDGQKPTAWEQESDPNSIWKNWSLAQAPAYEAIWAQCDALMLLRQESFDAVIDSRWLQEQGNAEASGVWQFKSRADVAAFCAHYESWTAAIWQHLPPHCLMTVTRDRDFNYTIRR